MNLVIDIGNTFVKAGVFDHDELVEAKTFDDLNPDTLQLLVDAYNVTHVISASTGVAVDEAIVSAPGLTLQFSASTPIPIENTYRTPETLGRDRVAAVVGASVLHPGANALVIDAGTCVTYDVLEEGVRYLGGNIAPGLRMRYTAMHTFTKRLPEVERPQVISLIGETTQEALQFGGVMGLLMEIAGYIEILRVRYPELNTMLTGGDAGYLAEHLKAPFTLQPHLVLIGLNQILQFNVARYN